MKNNHYQKLESVLNSATSTEIAKYIESNHPHIEIESMLNKVKAAKPQNNFQKISNDINGNLEKVISNYFKQGQAWVIAFVLECFYDDKYKINDLKTYMKALIKDDKILKEYVYEMMKDF